MEDKKKIRIMLLMFAVTLVILLLYFVLQKTGYLSYLFEEQIQNEPDLNLPELIDLSTEEAGETVTIQFTTIDIRENRFDSGRKRYVRILVDGKEVVSRLCDFYCGRPISPAVYFFRPKVRLNLGKHVITVEDEYYKVKFSREIEITEYDRRELKKYGYEYLFIEINAAFNTMTKFLYRYL